jgi:hypothetical protein
VAAVAGLYVYVVPVQALGPPLSATVVSVSAHVTCTSLLYAYAKRESRVSRLDLDLELVPPACLRLRQRRQRLPCAIVHVS